MWILLRTKEQSMILNAASNAKINAPTQASVELAMDIYKMTLYCSEALHSTLTASSSMRTDAWDWEAASLIIATAQASHKWFVCVTPVSLCGLKISYCQLPITKAVSTPHTAHVVTHWISSNRTPTICSPLKKKAAWPSEKSRYGSSQPFLFGAWQALAEEAHYTHSSNRRCCRLQMSQQSFSKLCSFAVHCS